MYENVPDATITAITESTTFDQEIDPWGLYFRSDLGFIATTDGGSLVGFGIMPEGVDEMLPPQRDRNTRFMDYPKGVGFRITNVPTAMIQPSRRGPQPPISAVEVVGVNERSMGDIRQPETKLRHIGGIIKHLSLLGQQKVMGHAAALNRVERQYNGYQIAQVNVPPTWLDEQKYVRHLHHVVEPNMLFIRGRGALIRRIGSVNLQELIEQSTSKG